MDVGAASISSTSDQGSGEVADGETSVIAASDAWQNVSNHMSKAWDHVEAMGHEADDDLGSIRVLIAKTLQTTCGSTHERHLSMMENFCMIFTVDHL